MATHASGTATSMIGQTVSHYRILERLGSGGMGVVYAAEDTALGRVAALKFLDARRSAGGPGVERFLREARSASSLNHPNICTIYEVGEYDGCPFLAMELVEGTTLRDRIGGRPLPLLLLCDLGAQVADALEVAHETGVVHRDIKPANIMITSRGQAKVMDFGLAKLLPHDDGRFPGRDPTLTSDGTALGTVAYMSPEQARGEAVDGRSDLFSLGLVLYEMATGRMAFGGSTDAVVFDSIVFRAPPPASELNRDLSPEFLRILDKALQKDRALRYQTAAALRHDLRQLRERLVPGSVTGRNPGPDETVVDPGRDAGGRRRPFVRRPSVRRRVVVLAALALVAVAAPLVWRFLGSGAPPVLTDKDTILLADFENRTAEDVFDGTLRQGLAVQLQGSPFLDVFPEARIRQALQLMGRSPDDRLTRQVAAEVCQRQGVKAFIAGTIARFDRTYAITLEAINSQTGEPIALAQREADGRDQVLRALSNAATDLRQKLGESLSSVQKFDAPLEATTSSLEALKAYSLAVQQVTRGRLPEAIVLFRRAVQIDPEFASAYQQLAVQSLNTNQPALAAAYAGEAFARRNRASEVERLRITNFYYTFVTGELEGAIDAQRAYKEAYPRDHRGPGNLSHLYHQTGRFEMAAKEAEAALRLYSAGFPWYENLAQALIRLNRFREARAVYDRAMSQNLDSEQFRAGLYQIGFVDGDAALMQEQIRWATDGRREHLVADWQAQTAAFQGEWRRSDDFARRATDLAARADSKENAAAYAANRALRAALLAQCTVADAAVTRALSLERNVVALTRSAVALALCNEPTRVAPLSQELRKRFPKDTLVNAIWLPVMSAALALHSQPASDALDLLQPAVPYEAAAELLPQYVRGLAQLKGNHPAEAAAEFKSILDKRGQAPSSVVFPLATLGMARASALAGDAATSRNGYDTLLVFWKSADADLPPVKAARRESALRP
ncbi:MAG: protein kinase [Vicinamibacterales bacterium]